MKLFDHLENAKRQSIGTCTFWTTGPIGHGEGEHRARYALAIANMPKLRNHPIRSLPAVCCNSMRDLDPARHW